VYFGNDPLTVDDYDYLEALGQEEIAEQQAARAATQQPELFTEPRFLRWTA
jgi:hypothetical protein